MITQSDAAKMPLADESVGVILTSPPYNIGLKYDGYFDEIPHDEHVAFTRAWIKESFRVAKEGARAYFILSDSMMWWTKPIAEEIGWTFGQILTWCKPNFVGKAGRIGGDWNYMSEPILLFRKGKRTPMLASYGVNTHNWFKETIPQSNFKEGRIHPAQLPVSLCFKILARTPGDPILDPFAGSGSVLVAAKQLGRHHIGFDIVPSTCQKARTRVRQSQTLMFNSVDVSPKKLPMFEDLE